MKLEESEELEELQEWFKENKGYLEDIKFSLGCSSLMLGEEQKLTPAEVLKEFQSIVTNPAIRKIVDEHREKFFSKV